jgi:hypothetical protein
MSVASVASRPPPMAKKRKLDSDQEKKKKQKKVQFVQFRSYDEDDNTSYHFWLQWTGNEKLLMELEEEMKRAQNQDEKQDEKCDNLGLDKDEMGKYAHFSTKDILTKSHVETLLLYANESHITHRMITGVFRVPKKQTNGGEKNDWRSISDLLYCENIEKLFHDQ